MTVDLDVLVRTRLLAFLKQETETRGSTVLYATHIFDGLDSFPTHICHLQLGSTLTPPLIAWPLPTDAQHVDGIADDVIVRTKDPERTGSRLMEIALGWLVEDNTQRKELEDAGVEGFRKRGKASNDVVTDSEVFYRKYDYSH